MLVQLVVEHPQQLPDVTGVLTEIAFADARCRAHVHHGLPVLLAQRHREVIRENKYRHCGLYDNAVAVTAGCDQPPAAAIGLQSGDCLLDDPLRFRKRPAVMTRAQSRIGVVRLCLSDVRWIAKRDCHNACATCGDHTKNGNGAAAILAAQFHASG